VPERRLPASWRRRAVSVPVAVLDNGRGITQEVSVRRGIGHLRARLEVPKGDFAAETIAAGTRSMVRLHACRNAAP
jgi:hypothetical protein